MIVEKSIYNKYKGTGQKNQADRGTGTQGGPGQGIQQQILVRSYIKPVKDPWIITKMSDAERYA